jgi:hypothetical protein
MISVPSLREAIYSIPLRHALPYPGVGSSTTVAPAFLAFTTVASFELLLHTIISLTTEGISLMTSGIEAASLKAGMITLMIES